MVKTQRRYILATSFLSGAAAIISIVSLGTQHWVTSKADLLEDNNNIASRASVPDDNYTIQTGLFSGVFRQTSPVSAMYDLSTICRFDLNVCALLCGDNMSENLGKIYNHAEDNQTREDVISCVSLLNARSFIERSVIPRADDNSTEERIFINAGVWLCTIIFLVLSAVMGLFAAGLAVWNATANPIHVYFNVLGLYIYNGIAFFSLFLTIVLWGVMFAKDLVKNIPCSKTFLEPFTTEDLAQLGYSYWILLVSLFLYLASLCSLCIRYYLMSKEPKVNVHIEDNADPVIYLY